MPATAKDFTLTSDDLAEAVRRKITEEGTARPYFDGDDTKPRLWDINELRNRPRAKWFIENVLEEKGLSVFFGPDKVGKTAAVSSLLWAWCARHDYWLNRGLQMHGPEDRRVLYILLEGQNSFYDRYDAWCHVFNGGRPIDGFLVQDEGLSLFERSMQWEKPETWTPSAKKLWNAIKEFRPHILVIDTLSRSTAGMDENSPQMAQVVGMLDSIRDMYDVSTIIVHHTSLNDGDRPRGHSSLKGAASSYVRIEGKPEDAVLRLVTGPHRNSDTFLRIDFTRASERASFVLQPSSGPQGENKQERLHRMVLANGSRWDLYDAAYEFYGDDKNAVKNTRSLVRNHENLDIEGNDIVAIEAQKAGDI